MKSKGKMCGLSKTIFLVQQLSVSEGVSFSLLPFLLPLVFTAIISLQPLSVGDSRQWQVGSCFYFYMFFLFPTRMNEKDFWSSLALSYLLCTLSHV